MRLVPGSDFRCPYCGKGLDAEASWECDDPPYPDQTVCCSYCDKPIRISQSIITEGYITRPKATSKRPELLHEKQWTTGDSLQNVSFKWRWENCQKRTTHRLGNTGELICNRCGRYRNPTRKGTMKRKTKKRTGVGVQRLVFGCTGKPDVSANCFSSNTDNQGIATQKRTDGK